MRTENIVLIPIRAGSKSIPDKNVKVINGRPMCFWAIDAALESTLVDQVWISTESDRYAQMINHYYEGLVWIHKRPELLATDTASSDDVLLEFAYSHDFKKILLVQATSPLIMGKDVDNAFLELETCDSIVSGVSIGKRFVWMAKYDSFHTNYNPFTRPFRQHCEYMYIENGAIYGTNRGQLIKSRCRLSGKMTVVEMPENTLVEVDEPEDWEKVEKLLQERIDEPRACYHYNSSTQL